MAGLAGNFCSAAFEESCVIVVGSSGSVFGFIGFYIADIALNFETMERPALQLVVILASVVASVILQACVLQAAAAARRRHGLAAAAPPPPFRPLPPSGGFDLSAQPYLPAELPAPDRIRPLSPVVFRLRTSRPPARSSS